jgi:uncharacterized protein YndB with AHSA1/START domain
VRLTRRYEASPAEVWNVLTEAETMARWLGQPRQLSLSVGGAFELELPRGASVVGRIRTLEPGRLLEMEWRRDGEDDSVVRFEVRNVGGGTVLVLDHTLIEERLGMSYIARWTSTLRQFEAAVGR